MNPSLKFLKPLLLVAMLLAGIGNMQVFGARHDPNHRLTATLRSLVELDNQEEALEGEALVWFNFDQNSRIQIMEVYSADIDLKEKVEQALKNQKVSIFGFESVGRFQVKLKFEKYVNNAL